MEFAKKMQELEGYIESSSQVETGVDIDYAGSLGLYINNSEVCSDDVELFKSNSNSDIAMAMVKS